MVKVIADFREAEVSEILKKFCEVEVKALPVGDFLVSEACIIERKFFPDFEKSIVDGRLFQQAANLKEYEKPIIVVEGEVEFRLNEKATFGAIASLISDFRIPILFLKDSYQTALFIFSLAKREQEGKEVNVRIQTRKKPKDIKLLQRMIVESLPNVGPASAEQLLKTFHTVENIFTAPEPYLAKVVGAKKAEKIREVLEKWYD